jgi:hypothetical protein
MPNTLGYSMARGMVGLILSCTLLACPGHQPMLIDGILQRGFEKSDFYDRGDCSSAPWWFDLIRAGDPLNKQWSSLGRPAAVRIRFVGTISPIGSYGHLGYYRRQVIPTQILSVTESSGCVEAASETP